MLFRSDWNSARNRVTPPSTTSSMITSAWSRPVCGRAGPALSILTARTPAPAASADGAGRPVSGNIGLPCGSVVAAGWATRTSAGFANGGMVSAAGGSRGGMDGGAATAAISESVATVRGIVAGVVAEAASRPFDPAARSAGAGVRAPFGVLLAHPARINASTRATAAPAAGRSRSRDSIRRRVDAAPPPDRVALDPPACAPPLRRPMCFGKV